MAGHGAASATAVPEQGAAAERGATDGRGAVPEQCATRVGGTVSGRARSGTPNVIARHRAELAAAGVELTDLTDTNPTRHGLFDPAILEIIARYVPRAGRYEPSPRGPWPARAALAERYGGDPDDYWLCASTSEAYGWLFALLADPGDVVVVPSPGYPLLEPLARLAGIGTAAYRTFYVHPAGWEVDGDHLAEVAGAERVRAVVAVNPNNPTGAYTPASVVETAAALGLPLIADEVFFPFRLECDSGDGPFCHTSATNLAADAGDGSTDHGDGSGGPARGSTSRGIAPDRLAGTSTTLTFGLDGLSKLLAAPQLKLSWIRLSGPAAAVAPAARALDHIADTYLSVSTPVALALPELLTLADASVARTTARLRTNLRTANDILAAYRLRTAAGGWMMLLDVPPVLGPDELCLALMDRAGLSVHPGYFYDLPDTTLALSLLPEPAAFAEACTRLRAALVVLADEASATTEPPLCRPAE